MWISLFCRAWPGKWASCPTRARAYHPQVWRDQGPPGQQGGIVRGGWWNGRSPANIITILADAAENIMDIDITRAQAARKRAEDALAKIKPEEQDAYLSHGSCIAALQPAPGCRPSLPQVKDVFTDKTRPCSSSLIPTRIHHSEL
jgi:hypothetical protein